jgi:hypothetical protein
MSCLRRALPTLPRLTPLIFTVLVGPLAGCSLLISADEKQCSIDTDCAARGAAFTGSSCTDHVCVDKTWGCLGSASPSPDAGTSGPTATFQIKIISLVTGKPSPSVSLRVCSSYDFACGSTQAPISPDATTGLVKLTVPVPFAGYFEVTSPGAITTLLFPPAQLRDGYDYPLLRLIPLQTLAGYAATFGTTLDMNLGHLILEAFDCQHASAAGISEAIDLELPSTRRFYVRDGLPSKTATTTDAAGLAGYVNLATGTVTVTGTLASTKQKIGSRSVIIRPGALSICILGPGL